MVLEQGAQRRIGLEKSDERQTESHSVQREWSAERIKRENPTKGACLLQKDRIREMNICLLELQMPFFNSHSLLQEGQIFDD